MRSIVPLLAITLFWPQNAFAACSNPPGIEGQSIYNEAHNVPQYCDDTNWIAMVGAAPEPTGPQNCSSIGETCADGSVYAGLSPDGNVPMYTTPADAPSTYTWNDGTSNYTDMPMANCTDNSPGTAATCQTGEANTAFLLGATGEPDYPFAAAEYCDGLSAHGYDDWYLPAQDELNVLYDNKNVGDMNGTFNETGSVFAGYYWSSSEASNGGARGQEFSGGGQFGINKITGLAVRCVRRHGSGEGLSQQTQVVPDGLVGHWRLDETSGTTTAVDTSGSGNDASYVGLAGSSFQQSGVIGKAVTIENNERIQVPNDASINNLDQFSISLWAKSAGAGAGRLFYKAGEYAIYSTPSTDWLRFGAYRWDTSGTWRTGDNALGDGWSHVVLTYDQSSAANDPVLYVDGVVVPWSDTDSNPTGALNAAAASDLFIGNTDGNQEWSNPIDDFRLYNRVITAAEVQEIYEARDGIRYNWDWHTHVYFDGNKWVPMGPVWPAPTEGLIGHWKLDETSGTIAYESVGGMTGTMQNGLNATNDSTIGAIGTSLHFDGLDDNITASPSSDVQALTNQLTLSAWVKAEVRTGNGRYIICQYDCSVGGTSGFGLNIYDTIVRFRARLVGTGNHFSDYSISLPLNEWHLITGTYDGTTMRTYVNGVEGGSLAANIDLNLLTHPINIGSPGSAIPDATREWRGEIDDVRIYNRALSASEIAKLYNMGAPIGQNTALPQGCPTLGDVCDDGTIYVGDSPDGVVEMFMTDLSYEGSEISWGAVPQANNPLTNINDTNDGDGNTDALVVTDSDTVNGGFQTHPAAQYCYDLVAHGADDWYLPAENELGLIYNGGSPLGDIRTGLLYWTSTERSGVNTQARSRNFDNGFFSNTAKSGTNDVRCVRKGPAPRCASPYGLESEMIYNQDAHVLQYCDGARWVAIGKLDQN